MKVEIYYCDICGEKINSEGPGFSLGVKPRLDIQRRDFTLCWGCGNKVMFSLGLYTDTGLVLISGKEQLS